MKVRTVAGALLLLVMAPFIVIGILGNSAFSGLRTDWHLVNHFVGSCE